MKSSRKALISAALACFAATAIAQEKTRVGFTAPASMAKYVAQHTLAAGDLPGHGVRIFGRVRSWSGEGPMIAGSRLEELRSVGWSDYTNLSGPGGSYNTWTLQSAVRFYSYNAIVSQNASWFYGSRKGAESKT